MNKGGSFIQAVSVLVGTIVGVGIFTVPYVVQKGGILTLFFYVVLLSFVEYVLLKHYTDVVLAVKKPHRIPGYVREFLGARYDYLARIFASFGSNGALLAYILVGGVFIHTALSPYLSGSVFLYTTLLLLLESIVVWFGIKSIARFEVFMTVLLFVAIGFIVERGFNNMDVRHYTAINWKYWFLPYGPILFSLGGLAAVPTMCTLLNKNKQKIYSACRWGVVLSAFAIIVFALSIIGITGDQTTPDTLVGLNSALGNGVVKLTLILGILSIVTSFLTIAQALREQYEWDWGIGGKKAFFLTISIPYALYLLGVQNLTKVVSLTGAISGGGLGVLLILTAWAMYKKNKIKRYAASSIALNLIILMLLAGVAYEIISVLLV